MHAGESQTFHSKQKVTVDRKDIDFYHTKRNHKKKIMGGGG